jgi:hypothetical protein
MISPVPDKASVSPAVRKALGREAPAGNGVAVAR